MSVGRSSRVTTTIDCLVVGLVAGAVYALHGFQGPLNRDLGVFTYGGEHVASGVPPYVGIFNSVGPLSDALPGLAIWAGRHLGVDPVSAERHLFLLIAAGCCVLLYVHGRDLLGSRVAGFMAAATLLTFQDFTALASDGPREKTAMVFLLLAALVLLGRRRWAAAGVATALATLTWQPVLAVAVAAALVTVLGARTDRLRAAAGFVTGGVATTAVFVGYFLLHGDLRTAIDGFVVVNAEYTSQPSLFSDPGVVGSILWHGYHASLWLVPIGLAALAVLAARAVPRVLRGTSGPPDLPLVATGAAAVVGTAWTVAVINGSPDLFVVLPFAALGVGGMVAGAAARLPLPAGRVVAVAVTVAAVVASTLMAIGTRSDGLRRERADVTAVLAAAPRGATLLSLDAPEVLALAGRSNPTPYQLFDGPMDGFLQATWPGGLSGYARWIAHQRPTLVAAASGRDLGWPAHVLHRDYRYAGRGPAWTWFVSRSAGPRVRASIHAAIRAVKRPAA